MKIVARLFALYREVVGKSEIELEVEEGITVARLIGVLEQEFPQLKAFSDNLIVAVNAEYVGRDFPLKPGDEVALVPPVSGG